MEQDKCNECLESVETEAYEDRDGFIFYLCEECTEIKKFEEMSEDWMEEIEEELGEEDDL